MDPNLSRTSSLSFLSTHECACLSVCLPAGLCTKQPFWGTTVTFLGMDPQNTPLTRSRPSFFSSCLVLSCLVLSYLILSYRILSCFIVSCLVLSYRILSCFIVSCLVLSYRILSCLTVFCLVLSYHILSCPIVSCLVLSCLARRRGGGVLPVPRIWPHLPGYAPGKLELRAQVGHLRHRGRFFVAVSVDVMNMIFLLRSHALTL